MITAEQRGKQIVRNSSFFKKISPTVSPSTTKAPTPACSTASSSRKTAAAPCTRVFPCPSSAGGGQQRAANPVVPLPGVPVESDDEFIDAEVEIEQEANGPAVPVQIDPAGFRPLADAAMAEANPAPALAGFHPPADALVARAPFQLPPDIRLSHYNFRERPDRNS